MGEVYRAYDSRLDREVAVKILPERLADDPGAQVRFEREAKAVAALSHPNILAIHDFGRDGCVSYAVMELLEGETLRQRLKSEQLSPRKALDLALQIARGLAAAHDKGVLHRDLKPENVFVGHEGSVKVLDFGLAKVVPPEPAGGRGSEEVTLSRHTSAGTVLGTTGYMSPEQVRGAEADHRSDIFSFGVLLYEMLAGQRAFQGESRADVMSAILKEDPPELSDIRAGVPPAVTEIVRHCLEKKPGERFQSARDLAFSLESIGEEEFGRAAAAPVKPAEVAASTAVLPFTNISSDKEQDYFCEGMAEEIINALAKLEGLRVASRTSAFQFKEKTEDIRRIGEALNVKTVLEGSVRTAGKKIRVTAQLINVDDGYHIWSERYDREMEDVFAIQDEISESIVGALRVKLTGGEEVGTAGRHTADLEAYQLYLKGQYNWNQHSRDSVRKAIHFFERAAERDPSYALAHAGVATAYSLLGGFGAVPPKSAGSRARAAIEKAAAIDDRLAEVHAAQGLIRHNFEYDWAGAEQAYERTLEANPAYVLAHCWYSFLLNCTGRSDEAVALAQRARALDPLSPYTNAMLGGAYVYGGQSDRAAVEAEKALELDANYVLALGFLTAALTRSARHEEAIAVAEKMVTVGGRTSLQLGQLACAYGTAGRQADARVVLEELNERAASGYVSPVHLAWAHGGCNELDAAFECLERAYEERNPGLAYAAYTPFDSLRSDPRFDDILRRLSLTHLISEGHP
jgi:serine/threonine-protein kinase